MNRNTLYAIVAVSSFMLSTTMFPYPSNAGASLFAIWYVDTVDKGEGILEDGQVGSLALDAEGEPRISFYDTRVKKLRYAEWRGSYWEFQYPDDPFSDDDVGQYSSIVFTPTDGTLISYYDTTHGDLKFASGPDSWTVDVVDSSSDDVGQWTSIAWDGYYAHISYYDLTNNRLKYAVGLPPYGWTVEIVDTNAGSFGTSIALDSNNLPHIAYYDNQNGRLMHAVRLGPNSWLIEEVDSTGDVGQYPSIAIDSVGDIHISYYDSDNQKPKYAHFDGSNWYTETVPDPDPLAGRYTSIAVNAFSNKPRISYLSWSGVGPNVLKYAEKVGSQWNIETADDSADVGYYTSIALAEGYVPNICYYSHEGDLKYAINADLRPACLEVNKDIEGHPNDIQLIWIPANEVVSHNIYYSKDKFLPRSSWNVEEGITDSYWYHQGAKGDGYTWFYTVKGKRLFFTSDDSTMGVKINIELKEQYLPNRNIYWISLPYTSQYTKASDIANELGPTIIDTVGKLDPETQSYILYYYLQGRWRGTDFDINPGEGVFVNSITPDIYKWAIVGTDQGLVTLTFTDYQNDNYYWISIPPTGNYEFAEDIVIDIEGTLEEPTKISEVAYWDTATDQAIRYYWDGSQWTGSNFPLPAGLGVRLKVISDFSWTPELLITPYC